MPETLYNFGGKVGMGQTARNGQDVVGEDIVGGLSWRSYA